MRVLVAGATGAIGVPAVRAVLREGHEVIGTSRVPERLTSIRGLGAEAVLLDALDPQSAERAVEQSRPDAIVELLTALPKNAPVRASQLRATNLLRTRGTENLLTAASNHGVTRIVAESIAFFYGPHRELRTYAEDDPIAVDAFMASLRPAARALVDHERCVLDHGGVVLRFGLFYGAESASTTYMVKMLRRRMLPLVGGGSGVLPWIHLHDAASAVAAAVEHGKPGEVYNVVDDDAMALRDSFGALAQACGAPKPFSIPGWIAKVGAPYPAEFFSWKLRVSNEKAKAELRWSPLYPSMREGAPQVAQSLGSRPR